jgi:magnesium transporter
MAAAYGRPSASARASGDHGGMPPDLDTALDTLPSRLGTAASHVVADVPVATADDTAGSVRRGLVGRRWGSLTDVAVCERPLPGGVPGEGEPTGDGPGASRPGVLRGLVTIEVLMGADEDTPLAELMDDTPPVVGPGVDQEVAAWTMVRHDESALAVVDEAGRFVGLIPPFVLAGVLLREHEEDLARLGGFLHDRSTARTASEEGVRARLWHRVPWLVLGLAGAMASAILLGRFEGRLQDQVVLAFFVPAIVYMADAVGTQTETVAVRGLSVGVSIRRVVGKESATGLLIGALVAAAFFGFASAVWGDVEVAAVVAVSLWASCSVASVVALLLPWMLSRLGGDPAFGSGPLATVVQDLLSLAIYLGVATLVLG